ncbi:ATP-dependent RNA helicase DBP9 [Xylaria bambusicola]|uniref:ATP-dependent RNA helicase DBP9 n=1 Tax=Xylaria bambusicola TaxID=326684 RepID=UPI002008DCAB|nr:ATP-dependent RNA helicase DBP9 [Xylaria bambusicola]KAI0526188.1 ATP-dependent RNA helicase DBP9 [Xylaria bambusicola]
MKRKIDDLREDKPPIALPNTDTKSSSKDTSFTDYELDSRLLTAIAGQSFHKPTKPQALAIPQILDGKSLVLRAKTGSGKTLCYLLPVIESILRSKGNSQSSTSALVLVPTRELADQVLRTIETFTAYCQKDVRAIKLSEQVPDEVVRSMLASTPHIVVATPSRACSSIKLSPWLSNLKVLVIDESDLISSYGYDEDLTTLSASIPKGVQTVLTSATLSSDVDHVKNRFCKNPVVLDLNEPDAEGEGITQYFVECGEDDKFLLIYVLLKLKLIRGKCLIFVADDVDRSYRLKLYLEQFGIRSAVLNSQLPIASRVHTVQQFNQGLFDILISSDEMEVLGDEADPVAENDDTATNPALDDQTSADQLDSKTTPTAPPKKKRKSSRRDKDYGVSRGIDFRNVAIVVNFDCPTTARSYAHRIGRTARAGQTGTSLTMVVPSEKFRKHIPTSTPSAENDEKTLSKIKKQQVASGKELKPWHFDWKTLEGFRYRVNDAIRAVTKVAVREARMREIRQELLKSDKLQRRFEENPAELHALRHDGQLRSARTQPHLKDVPDYLLPEGKKTLTANDVGFVPMKKADGKNRKGRIFKGKGKRSGGRKIDPLRSFKARPKAK